jgi:hypothetical protein
MANSEASDKIEAVLNEVISLNPSYEEGDMLLDWIVIGFTGNPDKEKTNAYPMFHPNGTTPTYRATGLLMTGLTLLESDLDT